MATPDEVAANLDRQVFPPTTSPSPGEHLALLPDGRWSGLYSCPVQPCEVPPYESANKPPGYDLITPQLSVSSNPAAVFDFAAALGLSGLADPDPSGFDKRRDAALPGWLPCYVADPTRDLADPTRTPAIDGEAELSEALLMLRREAPCPVTGRSPARAVVSWLAVAQLAPGALPGTNSTTWPCRRTGELDVTAAGLLHVLFARGAALGPAVRNRLIMMLKPWGGRARTQPYVEPDGTCLGVSVLESENHMLLQETDRYLIDSLVATTDNDPKYDVSTNGTRDWLLRFLRLQIRRDFYEYNALPYGRYQLKALWLLYDYSSAIAGGSNPIHTAAEGVIDWLFAKHAVSANLLRDSRPFRRLPEPKHFNDGRWFGTGTDAIATEAALLAGGGLQYGLDPANLTDSNGTRDFADLGALPNLGSLDDGSLPELMDVADTGYRLPPTIASWYHERFGRAGEGTFYLQTIHHRETPGKPLADADQFKQWNAGAELYSGNRNWTISAGGVDAEPADPGQPDGTWKAVALGGGIGLAGGAAAGALAGWWALGPGGAVAGAVVGGLLGLLGGGVAANSKVGGTQTNALWDTQAPVMRATSLLPTAVGLERSQTIRFASPHIAERSGPVPARMCVADGFLCGLDLQMPAHAFPDDACPLKPPVTVPAAAQQAYDHHQTHGDLGCLLGHPAPFGDWTIWSFDTGEMAINTRDPEQTARYEFAWVETPDRNQPANRTVHTEWNLQGGKHDWFVVHGYDSDNTNQDSPFAVVGDANNTGTSDRGTADFALGPSDVSGAWDLVTEGCDPTYFIVRTGHRCSTDILPRLHLNVAPRPRQPFACAGHAIDDQRGSIGMEVGGKCGKSRYGMYLYIYNRGCSAEEECPRDARSFGFVVAAPAENWTYAQFEAQVRSSIAQQESGQGYSAVTTQPMNLFVPDNSVAGHTVSFHWHLAKPTDWSIDAESGSASSLVQALGRDIGNWPLAASNVYDTNGGPSGALLNAPTDEGCFTVTGTPDLPEPRMLVVNLRSPSSPDIATADSAKWRQACP